MTSETNKQLSIARDHVSTCPCISSEGAQCPELWSAFAASCWECGSLAAREDEFLCANCARTARLAPPHDTTSTGSETSPEAVVRVSPYPDEASSLGNVTLGDLGFVFALGVVLGLAIALAVFVAGVLS